MTSPPPSDPGSWSHEPSWPPSGEYEPDLRDPRYGTAAQATTSEERNWSVAAHVGSFLSAWFALGLFAPLLVLLLKGNSSPFVRRHAVESLNFQLNALFWVLVNVALMVVLIGFVTIVLYGLFYLAAVIFGTVRASNGEEFRYPLTVRLVT